VVNYGFPLTGPGGGPRRVIVVEEPWRCRVGRAGKRTPGVIALLVAVAIAVVTASCATAPHTAPGVMRSGVSRSSFSCLPGALSCPARLSFRLSFTVSVNGRSRVFPRDGIPPRFTIVPGGNLVINVDVTVPVHATVTALWLGISRNGNGVGPDGPVDVRPILAHSRKPLTHGLHSFKLHWVAPAGPRRGISLHLTATWAAKQAMEGQTIADLVLPSTP
jgi:hypothetical protein